MAWVTTSLLSFAARRTAFGLGYLICVIVWLYVVWRKFYCLQVGLPHVCYRMAARLMAKVLLPLAYVIASSLSMAELCIARVLLRLALILLSLLSYCCTLYGAMRTHMLHPCDMVNLKWKNNNRYLGS